MRDGTTLLTWTQVALPPVRHRSALIDWQYSKTVIDQMAERHAERFEMKWLEMDVLDLTFGEGEFDLVIDKGVYGGCSCGTPSKTCCRQRADF
jgi:hypothetical protein